MKIPIEVREGLTNSNLVQLLEEMIEEINLLKAQKKELIEYIENRLDEHWESYHREL